MVGSAEASNQTNYADRRRSGAEDRGDALERGSDALEQRTHIVTEHRSAAGDDEGNEHDEHRVFDRGGAALVATKTTKEIFHNELLAIGPGKQQSRGGGALFYLLVIQSTVEGVVSKKFREKISTVFYAGRPSRIHH